MREASGVNRGSADSLKEIYPFRLQEIYLFSSLKEIYLFSSLKEIYLFSSLQEIYLFSLKEIYPFSLQEIYLFSLQEIYPFSLQEIYPFSLQEIYPFSLQMVVSVTLEYQHLQSYHQGLQVKIMFLMAYLKGVHKQLVGHLFRRIRQVIRRRRSGWGLARSRTKLPC